MIAFSSAPRPGLALLALSALCICACSSPQIGLAVPQEDASVGSDASEPPEEGECLEREIECALGQDDDCDGKTDCEDEDCLAVRCLAGCMAGICNAAGACEGSELSPAGTVCRGTSGPCDVEEVCDGTSAECPEEAFVAEGASCGDCVACDGFGGCEPIADGTGCGDGLACLSGECVACGAEYAPCCADGTCASLSCIDGLCQPEPPDAGEEPEVDAGAADAGTADTGPRPDAGPPPPVTRVSIAVVADIVQASRVAKARETARLVSTYSPKVTAVLAGGDNARYAKGSGLTLLQYYEKHWKPATAGNWGQFDSKIFPAMGNHEGFETSPAVAEGYFDYFANRFAAIKAMPSYHGLADSRKRAWYSFDINGWHFVALNSDCSKVTGGCGAGSAQQVWLKADLAAHRGRPIVAFFHHPRYFCTNNSPRASLSGLQALWATLYDARADFVFVGHVHIYQRFKPLNKASPATVEASRGIQQIVVGNSGVDSAGVCTTNPDPRVAKQIGGDRGVGAFFLNIGSDGSYSFQYKLTDGTVFDSGSGKSLNAP